MVSVPFPAAPPVSDLLSALLNQNTSPSGHSQRRQKYESTAHVSNRDPAPASSPTRTAAENRTCLVASRCRVAQPSSSSMSQRKMTWESRETRVLALPETLIFLRVCSKRAQSVLARTHRHCYQQRNHLRGA